MKSNNNITLRIQQLEAEIHKLEDKLAAINWERKKYIQFSEKINK